MAATSCKCFWLRLAEFWLLKGVPFFAVLVLLGLSIHCLTLAPQLGPVCLGRPYQEVLALTTQLPATC